MLSNWTSFDYEMILKDGLRKYKYINSSVKPSGFTEQQKGAIALFRTKENLKDSRGFIVSSFEAVMANASGVPSHWTANIFRYLTYKDTNRTIVEGHRENNLRQINQIFIDIDTKDTDINYLVLVFNDLGVMPTYILETPRGYQVFWVLSTPAYVNKTLKVISVLKMIRNNFVKYAQKHDYVVDESANSFGISRFPTKENVIFNTRLEYSMKHLIAISQRLSAEFNTLSLYSLKVSLAQKSRQNTSAWYELLYTQGAKIIGQKGSYGRDNAIFTMALANYSSGSPYEVALDKMLEWNYRLDNPLPDRVVELKVKSAYSGNYKGAQEDYARALIETHITTKTEALFDSSNSGKGIWSKFKKVRSERKYSHLEEWKEDLASYIRSKTTVDNPFVTLTSSEITEAIGIPARSLARIRKEYQSGADTTVLAKAQRKLGTTYALVNYVLVFLLNAKKKAQESYRLSLSELLQNYVATTPMMKKIITSLNAWESYREGQKRYLETQIKLII